MRLGLSSFRNGPFPLSILVFIPPLFSLFISMSGCGYEVLNMNRKGMILSADSNNSQGFFLSINPVLNLTSNPGLEWRLTDLIVEELMNWPGIKIRPKSEADFSLSGIISAYSSQIPYTYDINNNPLEYKISVSMSFSIESLKSPPGDQRIKEDATQNTIHVIPNLHEDEIYRLSKSDIIESKRAETQALERAIKRIVSRAMDQIMALIPGKIGNGQI